MQRTKNHLHCLLIGAGLVLGGCPSDDEPMMNDDTTTMADSGTTSTEDTNTTTSTNPPTATDPDTTIDPDSDTTDTDPTDDTGTSTTSDSPYDFDESPLSMFAQFDRMGMPAINTAVITSKDDYNESTPADDAAGTFVMEIVDNVTGLHAALDDDLMGAGLVPCMVDDCVAQAAPLVVPDTLKINFEMSAGFPNGRLPADPVIDVTLAVVLLDLTEPGQTAVSLVGTNPTENDLEFSDEFPYFAPPH